MKRRKKDYTRLYTLLIALMLTAVVAFVVYAKGDEETTPNETTVTTLPKSTHLATLPKSAPSRPAEPVAPPTEPTKKEEEEVKVFRYELTEEERWVVASVVTAEAGGEPYEGMMAVAQCILQTSEDDNLRPTEAVVKQKYTKHRPEPSEEAWKAVAAVFDEGRVVTVEPIKYFYAPALVYSAWHESQDYVMTIEGHKFFKEAI